MFQGRMKLLGTHVYPKNKYLTLQMSRSTKGVVCEDVFESLVTSNFTSLLCLPCIYLGSGTCIRRIAAMLVPFLWAVIANYLLMLLFYLADCFF